MQMAFHTGSMFPAEYRNDAFVAMRGHVLAKRELTGTYQRRP